jgi:hypothetical protein
VGSAADKQIATAKSTPTPGPVKTPAPPPVDDEGGMYTFRADAEEAADGAPGAAAEANDPSQAPRKFLQDEGDENPYGITALDDIPRCPFCAKEMDNPDAIICLHCGYNTQTRSIARVKRVFATTFWDWFKWLSPGIACVLVVLALIASDLYFCFGLKKDWWDPMDEWAETKSFSNGIRVWVTVMALGLMWVSAKFAFRRLVLNPRPPEIEKKK